jgi:hypothetical protein
MKAAISKEQSLELRKWLEKQRLPREIIDTLLSSNNASNTYKAYRQKKQITTDGWAIHFGANWARPVEKGETVKEETVQAEDEMDTSDSGSVDEPETVTPAETKTADNPEDIKVTDTVVSRTFMGLAEKLKKLKIEDVDKPQVQKIAFEIDKDHLAMLKKYAAVKGSSVGSLIRQAIREFLESI